MQLVSAEALQVRWDSQGKAGPADIESIYHLMYVADVRELLALCLARSGLYTFSSWQTEVRQVTKAGRQIKLYYINREYKA